MHTCQHGKRHDERCIDCTLAAELDYYERRANRALELKLRGAHEYWARKYHTQRGIISDRNAAAEARRQRQAQEA